jgi:hypothetical protein
MERSCANKIFVALLGSGGIYMGLEEGMSGPIKDEE